MSIRTVPPSVTRNELPLLPMRKFTVDEYHKMAQAGVFKSGDPFELLEGWIVTKMTRNPPHDATIQIVNRLLRQHLPPGWDIRIQSAVTTADSEPEPDLAAVQGSERTYLHRHPGPADVALLVEVADSSLAQDREEKGRIYARAAIGIYWIVNLVDEQIEVYTSPSGAAPLPSYHQRRDYPPGESLPFVLQGREIASIPVRELLP